MNHGDMAVLMKGIAPVLRELFARAFNPVIQRLIALEAREPAQGEKGDKGEDGADGLGFSDLQVIHDGERGFTFRFARGQQVKEFPFMLPLVLDRGVFKDGTAYAKGDAVTWAGSLWIAQKETETKPDGGDGWRLAVKRGRDGKDAK